MKTIKQALFLTFLIFSGTLFAQTSFAKIYSGNGYDRGEGVCQLADSGFLVTGTSSSFEDSPSQAFLMRVDSMGNFKWSKAYGGTESETGKRVMAVDGYGYFVAGTSSSSGSANFDNYLFFTDEAGNQQWETFTDKGGWERVNDAVLVASDTSVITVGQTDEGSDFVDDIYICKYSKTGQLIWEIRSGTPAGSDVANAVQMLTDTSFVVAGSYYVQDSLMNKAYVALYHTNGTLIWEKTFGETGNYWLNDVSLKSGMIKAVGEKIQTGFQDYDGYGVACSFEGVYQSGLEYHVEQSLRFGTMTQFEAGPSGRIFVTDQAINPNIPTYADGEDVLIIRYNSGFFWDGYGLTYSGIGQDQINEMTETSDGFAVAAGYNTAYGAGGNCVLLVKIGDANYFPVLTSDPDITNILDLSNNEPIENLIVYPNPVNDNLNLKLEGKEFVFTLFDLSGREMESGHSFGSETISFTNKSSGTYLLKVTSDGKEMTLKVLK